MGIAMGWGWGNPTKSYARGNAITYNRVDRANQRLADGGSVYTLSAQPGSTIAYNYVSNQRLRDSPLYHDGRRPYHCPPPNQQLAGSANQQRPQVRSDISSKLIEYSFKFF